MMLNTSFVFLFVLLKIVYGCPIKCRCTGTSMYCLYTDITTEELKNMSSSIPVNTTRLYLNGNKFDIFPTEYFKHLKYLHYLALNFNRLTELPDRLSEFFPRLRILYVTANQIKTVTSAELVSYQGIEILNLDQNIIEIIPDYSFSKMGNLKELLLGQNRINLITENTFYGLNNLVKIQLNNNQLKTLHKSSFKSSFKLKEIFLHVNRIKNIPNELFSNLKYLRTLYLYDNFINDIAEDAFQELTVDEIYLNTNHLKTLPMRLFENTRIEGRVYLRDNRFKCDCKLALILSSSMQTLVNSNKLVFGDCHSPSKFKRRGVDSIKPKELNCTLCDFDPCTEKQFCMMNYTSQNYTCVAPLAPIIDLPATTEEIDTENANYVLYAVATISALAVIGFLVSLYIVIINRRKKKNTFEISGEKYFYEKVEPEKDARLTGLTAKNSFNVVVHTPKVAKPEEKV